MGRTRQVRLEPDVVALIETDRMSLSAAANEAIRRVHAATGDVVSRPTRPQDGRTDDSAPITQPAPYRPPQVRRAQLQRKAGFGTSPGRCPHPLSRRIGDRCAVCGGHV